MSKAKASTLNADATVSVALEVLCRPLAIIESANNVPRLGKPWVNSPRRSMSPVDKHLEVEVALFVWWSDDVVPDPELNT